MAYCRKSLCPRRARQIGDVDVDRQARQVAQKQIDDGFQRQLRDQLPALEHWPDRIAEAGGVGERSVEYDLGNRSINDARISIESPSITTMSSS